MNTDPAPTSLTPDQLREWLQRTHGFNDDDLEANRAGRLSYRQMQQLTNGGLLYLGIALGLPLLAAAACSMLTGIMFIDRGLADLGSLYQCCLLGSLPLWFYPFTLIFIPTAIMRLQDGRSGQAGMALGEPRVVRIVHWGRYSGGRRHFYYVVDGQRLRVPAPAVGNRAVFHMGGLRCRCYYALHTKNLISIEPA